MQLHVIFIIEITYIDIVFEESLVQEEKDDNGRCEEK